MAATVAICKICILRCVIEVTAGTYCCYTGANKSPNISYEEVGRDGRVASMIYEDVGDK